MTCDDIFGLTAFPAVTIKPNEWAQEANIQLEKLWSEVDSMRPPIINEVAAIDEHLSSLRAPTVDEIVNAGLQRELEEKWRPFIAKMEQRRFEASSAASSSERNWRRAPKTASGYEKTVCDEFIADATNRKHRLLWREPCRVPELLAEDASVNWSARNVLIRLRLDTHLETFKLSYDFDDYRFRTSAVMANVAREPHARATRRLEAGRQPHHHARTITTPPITTPPITTPPITTPPITTPPALVLGTTYRERAEAALDRRPDSRHGGGPGSHRLGSSRSGSSRPESSRPRSSRPRSSRPRSSRSGSSRRGCSRPESELDSGRDVTSADDNIRRGDNNVDEWAPERHGGSCLQPGLNFSFPTAADDATGKDTQTGQRQLQQNTAPAYSAEAAEQPFPPGAAGRDRQETVEPTALPIEPIVLRRVSQDEVIVSISFYQPVRGLKLAEFDLLGSQLLTQVKAAFVCDEDVAFYAQKYLWSCFFINGAFYHENEVPGVSDFTARLVEHLRRHCPEKVQAGNARVPMDAAMLGDTLIPFNQRCAYLHRGDCEHRIVFTSLRKFDATRDCSYREAYPLRIFKPCAKITFCQACLLVTASQSVFNSTRLPSNPMLLCSACFDSFFKDEYGNVSTEEDILCFSYQDVE